MFGLFLGTSALAGYVEDSFKVGPTLEMCMWAGEVVMRSIPRSLAGVPLILKDGTDRPASNTFPLDAIYIRHWDELDAADKRFYTKLIEVAYKMAAKQPKGEFPKDFQDNYNSFMATCVSYGGHKEPDVLFNKTGSAKPFTEEDITKMIIGTASNQYLGGEQAVGINEALLICNELMYDINLIARMKVEGQPLEDMIQLAKASSELRQDRLERILRMLPEAYAHTGDMLEWMKKEYKECKDSNG